MQQIHSLSPSVQSAAGKSSETGTFGYVLRRTRLCIFLGLAALTTIFALRAGGRTEECDHACIAKRIVLALYPDLRGKNAQISLEAKSSLETEGPMGVFQVSVSTPVPDKPDVGRSGPPEMINQLWGIFMISAGPTRVHQVQCYGAELNEAKNRKLTESVDSHPEWSDDQVIQALKEAGAKFGPDAKNLVQSGLPFERLEPILGKIRLTSLHFQVRTDSIPPLAASGWIADFTARKGGRETRYSLTIEPFGGRVTLIQKL